MNITKEKHGGGGLPAVVGLGEGVSLRSHDVTRQTARAGTEEDLVWNTS